MSNNASLTRLTDDELLSHVAAVRGDERAATGRLVAALAELDRRKLYLGQGCSSLFTYCTQVLHLSEPAAYNRIEVARAALRFPIVLDKLEDGSVTLTAVRLLAPVLTEDNCETLLEAATHKSKREIEMLAATVRPKPDAATLVRKLPDGPGHDNTGASSRSHDLPSPTEASAASPLSPLPPHVRAGAPPITSRPQPAVAPLSAERYKIQFTASRQLHDKLRRAQELLRHAIPSGDPAVVFERALDLLISHAERQKFALAARPRDARSTARRSRHIPAVVKRAVWARDQAQCAFVGATGRCSERGFLEFHHVRPYADGGSSVTAANIELRCRAHNRYEAAVYFGVTAEISAPE